MKVMALSVLTDNCIKVNFVIHTRQRVNLIPGGQRQPRSGSPSELEHLRAQLTKMLEVTTRLCELNLLCPGGRPPHAG